MDIIEHAGAADRSNNKVLWLWVPAFAGTTSGVTEIGWFPNARFARMRA
jgi:hypothetical protein